MAGKRLPMRKLREILRLRYEVGLPHRAIARACSVGVGTVSLYVKRAREAGLSWPLPEAWTMPDPGSRSQGAAVQHLELPNPPDESVRTSAH